VEVIHGFDLLCRRRPNAEVTKQCPLVLSQSAKDVADGSSDDITGQEEECWFLAVANTAEVESECGPGRNTLHQPVQGDGHMRGELFRQVDTDLSHGRLATISPKKNLDSQGCLSSAMLALTVAEMSSAHRGYVRVSPTFPTEAREWGTGLGVIG
jgi:hypothetical protein